MPADATTSGGADHASPIEVVDYSPSAPEQVRKKRWSAKKVMALSLLAALLFALWFVFAARSVWVQVEPGADTLNISAGLLQIAWKDHYLVLPGEIEVSANKAGYYPLHESLRIDDEAIQKFQLTLKKLPGKLNFEFADNVTNAVIRVGDEVTLKDMHGTVEVPAGDYPVQVEAPRFQPWTGNVTVEGLGRSQTITVDLRPNWADVQISTLPVTANVYVGETLVGHTPGTFEILAGEHRLSLRAPGYKRWFKTLNLAAEQRLELTDIVMKKADGSITVSTTPAAAAISIDGRYYGLTPRTLKLPPGQSYTLAVTKVGYDKISETIKVASNEDINLEWSLVPQVGLITVINAPSGASVWSAGEQIGLAGAQLELPARDQQLEIRAAGYAPAFITVLPKPAAPQEIAVKLLTLEEAREAELARKAKIQTADGQTLILMRPHAFSMGASRRVRGRRSNEQLRKVELTRMYYIGTQEVTNERFKAFRPEHSSGMFFSVSLDAPDHPVVNVTWDDAAQYCNWLSQQEGLPPAYVRAGGRMQPAEPKNIGYRLLSEAEWAWAARFSGNRELTLFPWGEDVTPPTDFGNFADRTALGLTSAVIDNYVDGFPATSPVANFAADPAGLYDMAGNVSEWTQDIYRSSAFATNTPAQPAYVIRGSSWQHSRISELRPTYRDSSDQGRPDLGFRIGRYLE
ncbi:MAG: SUMF1/EgtB/PvdO family nonheme iron enzyme [Gammaproteobacteria bacterium]|nr:SUMF1/EgtB/PvdO family nonheme iron enzyme [Gammaproteobacteria bacterium]